jgi:hypothetical protein
VAEEAVVLVVKISGGMKNTGQRVASPRGDRSLVRFITAKLSNHTVVVAIEWQLDDEYYQLLDLGSASG